MINRQARYNRLRRPRKIAYSHSLKAKSKLLYLRFLRVADPLIGGLRRKWRSSIFVRLMSFVVFVTVGLVIASGTFIMYNTQDDLTRASLDQALHDSARATLVAQQRIDAYQANEQTTLPALMGNVREIIQNTSGSSMIYVTRQPGQPNIVDAPQTFSTNPLFVSAVSDDLRNQIATTKQVQLYQAAELSDETGKHPGVVVATRLEMPGGAGIYEVYIGYSFAHTENSLQVISRTMLITAIILLTLIIMIVGMISRTLLRPVRDAAKVSRRVAAGSGKARMELLGDEYFDALAMNFNDMADTLNARIFELNTLSEMQQRFVSDVSHELRTPFTTIRMANDMLQDERDGMTESQAKALSILGNQVDRFERLLADLLEISRYDAGRVTLDTEPTQLAGLCQELIDGLQPLSQSLIELRVQGGYDQADVDPVRIRRIVSNLIGNAIEHGEGKPIIVTLDSNDTAYAITVRDFGIGMSTETQQHVFDRFWRADPSRKRHLGGTGLGLAIAREDAQVHGGSLDVWSAPDQGSVFRLTLPRRSKDKEYYPPLPLVPEDVADTSIPEKNGWLKRPRRLLSKGGR